MRDGIRGNGAAREGHSRWKRLTDHRAGSAKSVFHFDVQGSVAKSTHAGLPWLRFLRRMLGSRVHFWPFDGWAIPAERSVIAEAYPALLSDGFEREGRTADQHDAYSIAAWMSQADRNDSLPTFLNPPLTVTERNQASIEGWILGVTEPVRRVARDKPTKATRSIAPVRDRMKKSTTTKTTEPGYTNRNSQMVLRRTGEHGNDHNQFVYVLRCTKCHYEYGANGSDIFQRRCPSCGGGAPGLE